MKTKKLQVYIRHNTKKIQKIIKNPRKAPEVLKASTERRILGVSVEYGADGLDLIIVEFGSTESA